MSIQEGTRDPQAGTSDAPPGREMQVRQGAQGPPVEEAATEQFHTECPPGMGAWGPEFEMYCDAKYTPSVHQMVRGL